MRARLSSTTALILPFFFFTWAGTATGMATALWIRRRRFGRICTNGRIDITTDEVLEVLGGRITTLSFVLDDSVFLLFRCLVVPIR